MRPEAGQVAVHLEAGLLVVVHPEAGQVAVRPEASQGHRHLMSSALILLASQSATDPLTGQVARTLLIISNFLWAIRLDSPPFYGSASCPFAT